MVGLRVTYIPTILEPSATASAAAEFAGSLADCASRTDVATADSDNARCRGCICRHALVSITRNIELVLMLHLEYTGSKTTRHMILHVSQFTLKSCCQQLTCTSLDALGPCVIKLCVADISAFLEPSTAGSATAEFARFLGGAALGANGTEPWVRRYDNRRHLSA